MESVSKSPKSYNDHNVYILGAGFSAEAGLPLVRNFMNVMRDSLAWLAQQGGRQREIDAISAVLEFRLRAASAGYRVTVDLEDVEELFSLAAATPSEDGTLAEQVTIAIAATLDYASQTAAKQFCRLSKRGNTLKALDSWKVLSGEQPIPFECPLHEYYMGLISGAAGIRARNESQRDTLITFNYDLIPEQALFKLGVPFSYAFDEQSAGFHSSALSRTDYGSNETIRVLKVHGSVNWALNESGQLIVHGSYQDVRASGGAPMLIPPTWRKGFGPQLSPVWDAAVREIRTATRLIVIGYSIPTTDLHFKFLLAVGLQDNISLRSLLFVNPQAELLKRRFFEIVRPEHEERGAVVFLPEPASSLFLRGYRSYVGREPDQEVMATGPF